jgi:hypothetical protein
MDTPSTFEDSFSDAISIVFPLIMMALLKPVVRGIGESF